MAKNSFVVEVTFKNKIGSFKHQQKADISAPALFVT